MIYQWLKKNCSDFGKTQKMNSGTYLNGQRVPREALNTPKEPWWMEGVISKIKGQVIYESQLNWTRWLFFVWGKRKRGRENKKNVEREREKTVGRMEISGQEKGNEWRWWGVCIWYTFFKLIFYLLSLSLCRIKHYLILLTIE